MLAADAPYDRMVAGFRWNIPDRYNMAAHACDAFAERDPERTALIHVGVDGTAETWSYAALRALSCRMANALLRNGARPGDRIGILLGQGPRTAALHFACYRAGLIAQAAGAAVRGGSTCLAAGRSRRARRGHGDGRPAEARRDPRPPARPARDPQPRRSGRGRTRLRRRHRARQRQLHDGRLDRRRPGADVLHLRHDGRAEGRLARPPRASRPHSRHPDEPGPDARAGATGSGRRPTGPGRAGCSTC